MKLFVQPGDSVMPIVHAINRAKKSVEILVFRLDRGEIEKALASAVNRGVFVHALIAYTNRGGERNLRKLEMRLLSAGVTVARTADDLARYHGKMLIIDRRELYLLAFNFTYLDMEHSRSFGIMTTNAKLVQEAMKLFEADAKRQAYTPSLPNFIVSPANSRKRLADYLRGAKKELLIYDPDLSDEAMIKILEERLKAGVDIRIIGRVRSAVLPVHKMRTIRLHTRTIVRDGHQAFIGSQSLREVELGARREIGIIFRDSKIVNQLISVFQEDWAAAETAAAQRSEDETEPAIRVARKVAKAITKDLPPVAPVVEDVFKELVGELTDAELDPKEVEETVKDAVKDAVREVVRDVVEDVVVQNGNVRH